MTPRQLELADEFCKLVGAPDLLTYLDLDRGASAEEAAKKLKARRRYMQGMQSNPKYKTEALFLIKNFAALEAVLQDPRAHLDDIARRQESVHLPILEMTIQGVLKGGNLSQEQEAYLRRNAKELGVSDETFDDVLRRLLDAAGLDGHGSPTAGIPDLPALRPSTPSAPEHEHEHELAVDEESYEITDVPPIDNEALAQASMSLPPRRPPTGRAHVDHYEVLGLSNDADSDAIRESYRNRLRDARAIADPVAADEAIARIEAAWAVLGDEGARRAYDMTATGPPARERDGSDPSIPLKESEQATAPPIRVRPEVGPPPVPASVTRSTLGPRAARLEVLGEPVRAIRVGSKPFTTEVMIRNAGDLPLGGRISTDEGWLIAQPSRLDPEVKEQTINVLILPRDMYDNTGSGAVTIHTDTGDRISVVFEVERAGGYLPVVLGAAALLALGALFVTVLVALVMCVGGTGAGGLTITVNPTSERIEVDGVPVGKGPQVSIDDPPSGAVEIKVYQTNYTTHRQMVKLEPGRRMVVPITLQLDKPLDFRPSPEMVMEKLGAGAKAQVPSDALSQCIRERGSAIDPTQPRDGFVRMYICRDGKTCGVQIEGPASQDKNVERCVIRHAATVRIPPLTEGDYGTLKYKYEVKAEP